MTAAAHASADWGFCAVMRLPALQTWAVQGSPFLKTAPDFWNSDFAENRRYEDRPACLTESSAAAERRAAPRRRGAARVEFAESTSDDAAAARLRDPIALRRWRQFSAQMRHRQQV